MTNESGRMLEEYGAVWSRALKCPRLMYSCRIPDLGYHFHTCATDLETARKRRDRDLAEHGINIITFSTERVT